MSIAKKPPGKPGFRSLACEEALPTSRKGSAALRDRQQLKLIDFDDLAVTIEAAVAAHAVGKLHFAALRAHGAGGSRDLVVGAATGMGAGTAHLEHR